MLTQAMPAVTRALSGVLPPVALRQLTQALGNCNQTVVQRGDVVMRPDAWTNANNKNGTYSGDTWNTNNFGDLLNNIDNRQQIDISNTQYGDQVFDFSQRLGDNIQNIFNGGDTINIGGDTIYGDTIINNPPGVSGRDGRDGRDGIGRDGTSGRDGAAGAAGDAGPSGPPGSDGRNGVSVIGPPGAPGAAGQNGSDGRDGAAGRDGFDGRDGTFSAKRKKITYVTGGTCELSFNNYEVISDVTFDPETCEIHLAYEEREEIVAVKFKPDTTDGTFFAP